MCEIHIHSLPIIINKFHLKKERKEKKRVMNEDTSLNPICLLSRTDTQTFSLFHSFFLVSITTEEQITNNNNSNNRSNRNKQRRRDSTLLYIPFLLSHSFFIFLTLSFSLSFYLFLSFFLTLTILFPSFLFFFSRLDCKVSFRIPSKRDRLDDVETAIKYFSTNISTDSDDSYGNFVITTSDGSRFYALWRGSTSLLFIAVISFS